jgi:hypothetical protein
MIRFEGSTRAELEGQLISAQRANLAYWGLGFLALLAGGYWLANYPGMLLAVGFGLIALAAAQEIKSQLCPVFIWAMRELEKPN